MKTNILAPVIKKILNYLPFFCCLLFLFLQSCFSNNDKVKLACIPLKVTSESQNDLDSIKLFVFQNGIPLSDTARNHFTNYPPKDSLKVSKVFFSITLRDIKNCLFEVIPANSPLLKRHSRSYNENSDSLKIDAINFRFADSAIDFRIKKISVADSVFEHHIVSPSCTSNFNNFETGEGLRVKEKISDHWYYIIYSYIHHSPL
jgi:hypothetical protein